MTIKKILIISAHPDDEVLGAGGTILKLGEQGHEIHWLIVTNMLESMGFETAAIAKRQAEIDAAAALLKFSNVVKLDYPSASLSEKDIPELISKIGSYIRTHKIQTVFSVNRSDAHSDHRVLASAVFSATKTFRYPSVKEVLMYECPSETDFSPVPQDFPFIPNYYVDITPYMAKKIEASKIYASEFGEHPFPRSLRGVEALAVIRGATAGVEYAEAFQIVKWIDS
jgi:LmbE family N-acetylglucosaminyl deacetylase